MRVRRDGRQPQSQAQESTGPGHSVAQHMQQEQRIDVASGEHGHHWRLETSWDIQQRRDGGGARRFHDELRAFEAE